MDIRTPDNSYTKVHVNTDRGGVPDIPVNAAEPPKGAEPGLRDPVERPPVEQPVPRPAPAVTEPFVPMGPEDPNAFPHPIQPPHSHQGQAPILGKDDVADLPEFTP
jgi:hypothetical protein